MEDEVKKYTQMIRNILTPFVTVAEQDGNRHDREKLMEVGTLLEAIDEAVSVKK